MGKSHSWLHYTYHVQYLKIVQPPIVNTGEAATSNPVSSFGLTHGDIRLAIEEIDCFQATRNHGINSMKSSFHADFHGFQAVANCAKLDHNNNLSSYSTS